MGKDTDVDKKAGGTCVVCGNGLIKAVCHHCNRYVCESHKAVDDSGLFHIIKKAYEFTNISGFRDTKNGEKDDIHCPEHKHYIYTYNWLLIISVVCTIIRFLEPPLLLNRIPGQFQTIVVIALWIAWFALKIIESLRRRLSGKIVPLLPHWDFKIEETLTRNFNVDQEIKADWENPKGKLTATPTFTESDKQRYEDFLSSYRPSMPTRFDAGPIAIENIGKTSLGNVKGFYRQHFRLIYAAKNYNALQAQDVKREFEYDITDLKSGKEKFTFWWLPHLSKNSAGDKLELHLVFTAFAAIEESIKDKKLKISLKKLSINLPPEPQLAAPLKVGGKFFDKIDPKTHDAILEEIPITQKDTAIELLFKGNIYDQSPTLKGAYELNLSEEEGTFSGFKVKEVLDSHLVSDPGEAKSNKASTKITGEFTIKTTALVNEYTYASKPQPKETYELPNFADHNLISGMIDALNKSDVYVKQLSEATSWSTLTRERIKNRLWTFIGKAYEKIYPIDVHLILQGRETYNSMTPENPFSKIEFTVFGKSAGPDMKSLIHRTYSKIQKNITELIYQYTQIAPSEDVQPPDRPVPEPVEEIDTTFQTRRSTATPRFDESPGFPEDVAPVPPNLEKFIRTIKRLRSQINRLPISKRMNWHDELSSAIGAFKKQHAFMSEDYFRDFLLDFPNRLDIELHGEE
ncbi:hypothetical protein JXJ21_00320 [candidate division KSB1 bacterium]|nr:hypothetical protein [candidate division KSB1 bacterium]